LAAQLSSKKGAGKISVSWVRHIGETWLRTAKTQTKQMDRFKKAAEHKVRQAMQVCLCAPSVVFSNFR